MYKKSRGAEPTMTLNLMDNHEYFSKLNETNTNIGLTFDGGTCTYAILNQRINQFAGALSVGKDDLHEERIAFLMPTSLDYVTTLFGIWRAGGIAVPLNLNSAIPELEHALTCAGVTRLVVNPEYQDKLISLCSALDITIMSVDEVLNTETEQLPIISAERRAMILFTSGTTNKPKGVVSTHKNIISQITSLIEAWAWQETDTIPLFLPLHHVHGIINVLCCGLWAGARIHLFTKFDLPSILLNVKNREYSVFMAVPTIYVRMINHLKSLPDEERQEICAGFKAMRLNVSGSAACPVTVFNQWLELTGQTLLERYGMTEIGMGLSNPYKGERRAGTVGIPLPGVEIALFDEDNNPIEEENIAGEIRVKGPTVFLEYWDNPEASKESFIDGWFCTGDIAVLESGYFRIMGRSSVDIIKSGGYKLSALEIEGTLLNHDNINECAVIGLADDTWGEAVAAVLVLKQGTSLNPEELKAWCAERMSAYKIPKKMKVVDSLPRNTMGKVTKPALKDLFFT
jgi:malonyl-CoA/methylmalonyl-CoA synthetase